MLRWRDFAVGASLFALLVAVGTGSQAADILLISDQAHSTTGGNLALATPRTTSSHSCQGLGHTVVLPTGSGGTSQFRNANGGFAAAQGAIAANGIDLVIVSRVTDSGSYSETDNVPTGVNRTGWNGITTPVLMMRAHWPPTLAGGG